MRRDAREECFMRHVSYAELTACFLDELGNRWIIDVANTREQMVLDLVIQSTGKPGNQPVFAGKIDGRFDLMGGPGVRHPARPTLGHREIRFLHTVR